MDGTSFHYCKLETYTTTKPTAITDVRENLKEWYKNGKHIKLITTGPHKILLYFLP